MNGVNFIPQYPDLRNRCFIVNLKKLDTNTRKNEHELEERFTEVWPKILEALFKTVSAGLANTSCSMNVKVGMKDACDFVIWAASNIYLCFTAEEFVSIV